MTPLNCIQFLTRPKVSPVSGVVTEKAEKFYVSCFALVNGNQNPEQLFLHNDGIWRDMLTNENGVYKGLFNSRKEAQLLLDTALPQVIERAHPIFDIPLPDEPIPAHASKEALLASLVRVWNLRAEPRT